jgi:predicted phage tail protein
MDAESWLTSELAAFGCAACGQAYGEGHIRLIAQREELFFVDLSCDHCGSQAVAIVTIQIDGDRATLDGGELVRVEEMDRDAALDGPPVSADDVLDVHDLLDDFEGDVHQLIARFDGEAT